MKTIYAIIIVIITIILLFVSLNINDSPLINILVMVDGFIFGYAISIIIKKIFDILK